MQSDRARAYALTDGDDIAGVTTKGFDVVADP